MLIQTAQVPQLLGSAKILPKNSTLRAERTNVTDDRQTDDRQTDRRLTPNVTFGGGT